jgi:tRNA U34 5-methylaminomethyl-2-thiouridine-forming methyltransferase MnmC
MPDFFITEDGSHTLYVPDLDEHYHSVHGAVQESMHIFIRNGFETIKTDNISILEIGFGTGLNAFLTASVNMNCRKKILYTTIEKFPLPKGITEKLNYTSLIPGADSELFSRIHSAPWNCDYNLTEDFVLNKVEADATDFIPEGSYNLIYFDAFGPDKQPEMWTPEIFRRISGFSVPGSVFVTYSAKGIVKRSLRECGFTVKLLPGPPGKRHIIRALKNCN